MALFGNLSMRLTHILDKLTKRGKLTELEIKESMREIRIALLEADVNYLVVKDFVKRVSEKAVGDKVLKSLTPGQQVVKIVHEELTELLGNKNAKLDLDSHPSVILMCGLQGAGKTTMCGKLANMLKGQGKKVLLVACDIYRPAAINQLKVVGSTAKVDVFEEGTKKPQVIAKDAMNEASKKGYDVVIIDTAGRLHINEELMQELKDIKDITRPNEILLTVDSMTGQDGVTVATAFNDALDISGVILTKLDGDTRGGVALSIKQVVNKPIKFCGIGEKISDIEAFHPDRMASRILNMGDVLTLIEKAQATISEEEAKKMEEKFRKNAFTLDDYITQFDQMKKMGGIASMLSMIPGLGKLKLNADALDEKQIEKIKAIIRSMTPKERENPEIIKGSHKKRIASGSGTSIQDVNTLLKNFEQTKDMMKRLKSGKGLSALKGMGLPF
ncbi:MAG: signal recognition particle protein [Clostridiales bacterium]|nr:signal recognition particle protein [Clostridiales bacterium]